MPLPRLAASLLQTAEQYRNAAMDDIHLDHLATVPESLEIAGRAYLQAAAELRARAAYEKERKP